MRFRRASIMVAATGLLALSAPALAADPDEPEMIEPLPLAFDSGWYLRGDLGYRFNAMPELSYVAIPVPLIDERAEDSWGIGAGAGYRFNRWLRLDATVDYGAAATLTAVPAPGLAASVELTSWTLLANAYLDLGKWWGITPYVGAGLGASRLTVSDGALSLAGVAVASLPETSSWDFSYALMAGASLEVTTSWTIDVGYRYLALGDGATSDGFGGAIELDDLAAHEIRVGVRFLLD